MAFLEPSDSSPEIPSTPSFTLRTTTQENKFSRSISTSHNNNNNNNDPFTPPRLSTNSIVPPRLYVSQPSSPRNNISFTTTCSSSPSKHQQDDHDNNNNDVHTIYRCISSVLKKDGQILSIASSNGLVYTGSQSNIVRIWKLPEFTECAQLKTKSCIVVALQVSNDKVYAAYADCKIRVWHRTWEGAIKHVRVATIPRPGNYVRSYITGKDKMMKHVGPITSMAISISDDILYSASFDTTVKVWRISDLKCIETIQAHQEPINAIVVADDDGVLYTASDDATVRVWRRNFCSEDRPHSLTVTLPAKHSPVKALTLTTDGGVLYGGCTDGYVHYWLKGWFSGQLQYGGALQGHTHAVMCLANVANYVVSGSADSTSRVWIREQDAHQHKCLAVLQGHRGPIRCVSAFVGRITTEEVDQDGCTICTGSLDGVLKVWRVKCSSTTRGVSQNNSEYFDLS